MNNLYIINEVLKDYTSGMVVISAPSLESCREIYVNKFYWSDEFDPAIKDGNYKVIENVNESTGVVSYSEGGS